MTSHMPKGAVVVSGVGAVAAQIEAQYRIKVGFTLDTIGGGCGYIASPGRAGAALKAQPAVLAIMGFESEVFSGKLVPHDNNRSNPPNPAAGKSRSCIEGTTRRAGHYGFRV